MICRYSKCRHESKKITDENFVKVGSAYYHSDCFDEKETVEKIKKTYADLIDPYPIWSQVVNVINTIIYKNGVSPDYLLFAVEYGARHKILSHAPGLYYIVKNKNVMDEYERKRAAEIAKTKFEVKDDDSEFIYQPVNKKSITDLIAQ